MNANDPQDEGTDDDKKQQQNSTPTNVLNSITKFVTFDYYELSDYGKGLIDNTFDNIVKGGQIIYGLSLGDGSYNDNLPESENPESGTNIADFLPSFGIKSAGAVLGAFRDAMGAITNIKSITGFSKAGKKINKPNQTLTTFPNRGTFTVEGEDDVYEYIVTEKDSTIYIKDTIAFHVNGTRKTIYDYAMKGDVRVKKTKDNNKWKNLGSFQ